MKRFDRCAFLMLALAALGACSRERVDVTAAPVAAPSHVVTAGYDRTFTAVVDAFRELNLPIQYLDRNLGVIETAPRRGGEKTYSARVEGERPMKWEGIEYADVRARLTKESDDRTRVTLDVGVNELDTATGRVAALPSTGSLEKRIFEEISDEL